MNARYPSVSIAGYDEPVDFEGPTIDRRAAASSSSARAGASSAAVCPRPRRLPRAEGVVEGPGGRQGLRGLLSSRGRALSARLARSRIARSRGSERMSSFSSSSGSSSRRTSAASRADPCRATTPSMSSQSLSRPAKRLENDQVFGRARQEGVAAAEVEQRGPLDGTFLEGHRAESDVDRDACRALDQHHSVSKGELPGVRDPRPVGARSASTYLGLGAEAAENRQVHVTGEAGFAPPLDRHRTDEAEPPARVRQARCMSSAASKMGFTAGRAEEGAAARRGPSRSGAPGATAGGVREREQVVARRQGPRGGQTPQLRAANSLEGFAGFSPLPRPGLLRLEIDCQGFLSAHSTARGGPTASGTRRCGRRSCGRAGSRRSSSPCPRP